MSVYKTKKADLKGKYKIHLEISFILTLLILIAAFKYVPKAKVAETPKKNIGPDITIIDNIDRTDQKTEPPELPKPAEPIVSVEDNLVDIEFAPTDLDPNANLDKPPARIAVHKKIEEEDKIFVAVEEMPKIIGGIGAIQSKVQYTELAKRMDVEGTIYVEAVINEEGKVIEAKIIKGLLPDLDEMSLNAVKSTLFKPGKQRGKPVKVRISIPIKFRLY